jgi:hypothetical protein
MQVPPLPAQDPIEDAARLPPPSPGEVSLLLGALGQWEGELRVVDRQEGAEGEEPPRCVGRRGAAPPPYSGGPTGYRRMRKRQQMGEPRFAPAHVETTIRELAAAHPDRPASAWEWLRSVLADGTQSPDRRLEPCGRLEPERFPLQEATIVWPSCWNTGGGHAVPGGSGLHP